MKWDGLSHQKTARVPGPRRERQALVSIPTAGIMYLRGRSMRFRRVYCAVCLVGLLLLYVKPLEGG